MVRAAVFDLDNTLVRGSSLFHFGAFAAWHGLIPPGHVLRFAWAEARYARGGGEPVAASSSLAARVLPLVQGQDRVRMVRLARAFAERRLHRLVLSATMAELARHKRRGRPVFLATASPQELADAVAWRLGITRSFGTVAEVVDGRYTGALTGPLCHGPAKAARVRAGLAEQGIDLADCAVYSDSVHDLPMLVAGATPYAVNPDAELARIARRNGWTIIDGSRDRYLDEYARLQAYPFVF